MRRTKTTVAALCAALALTAGAAAAQSTPADRTTFVTFSGPVSIPGMTLPAGTYTFRLADSQTDRHIVQVFNREQTKLFTTLLAIPAQRPTPEGDPVITFKETPSDRPPAVHFWYYAGERAGNELVYPKAEAMLIARASGEGVMAVDSDGKSIDDWKSGGVSRVTSADAQPATPVQTDTTSQQPPTPAPQPSTTPEQPAMTAQQPATPPPTATPERPAASTAMPAPPTVPPPTATDNESRPVATSGSLPRTASELPLVGLIGLLALGGAFAIRAARAA